MSGWHPNETDGGILTNPDDPHNPAQAFPPVNQPLFTPPFYYGNGCDVRLRPSVINTLISENLALVDGVGLQYNPTLLTNQKTAVDYVVQKGLPRYAVLAGQASPASYYTGALSPPLLNGYNNGMLLVVIPNVVNAGFVRIDIGAGWWVPVLTEKHAELIAGEWPANTPQLIAYFNGAFFAVGKVDLSEIYRRLANLEARMTALEARVAALEIRMTACEAHCHALGVRVAALEAAGGDTGWAYGGVGSVWGAVGTGTAVWWNTPNSKGWPGTWKLLWGYNASEGWGTDDTPLTGFLMGQNSMKIYQRIA